MPHEPLEDSPADDDTTVSGSTINLKVNFWEWVKCYVTNAPKPPDHTRRSRSSRTGPRRPTPVTR
jgi:hypothetical protein